MRRRAIVLLAALLPVAIVAAVVIADRSGTSRTPAKLPVAVGGASTAASRAAMSMGAPDAALYPIQRVVYEAAPGLAELGGSAAAYKVTSDVSIEQVRALASALGVTGEVSEPYPGSFSVGTDERQLVVQGRASGLWYLSSNNTVTSGAAVGVACGPTADCVAPTTTVPQRPANLPSADEARAKALDLLEATGMDLRNATVKVDDFTTAWHIRVDPVIDGTPVEDFGASVTITDAGVVAANGFLGRVAKVDAYPLLGTRAAIDALNRGEGGTFGGGPRPMPAIATPLAPPMPAIAASPVSAGGHDCPAPPCATTGSEQASPTTAVPLPPVTGETPVRPLPPEPGPTSTLPPLKVTVTDAAHVLAFTPSYDGTSAYLVPAYRLITSESRGDAVVYAIDRSWFAPPPEPTGSSSSPPPPDAPASASPGSAPTKTTTTGPSTTTPSAVPNKSS